MRQHTPKGLREGTARQPELTGREHLSGLEDLIKGAPTEPEAFLRWAEQRRREEGKFELSRGRVVCNMIFASSFHSRVIWNLAEYTAIESLPTSSAPRTNPARGYGHGEAMARGRPGRRRWWDATAPSHQPVSASSWR
jgi:hypothetical protein